MDEDGFFMGELDGVRGLVPSNFLTEAPDQYNNQQGTVVAGNINMQRNQNSTNSAIVPITRNTLPTQPTGPGARGPPPPPREIGKSKEEMYRLKTKGNLVNTGVSTQVCHGHLSKSTHTFAFHFACET